jgi:hypothetical protein
MIRFLRTTDTDSTTFSSKLFNKSAKSAVERPSIILDAMQENKKGQDF